MEHRCRVNVSHPSLTGAQIMKKVFSLLFLAAAGIAVAASSAPAQRGGAANQDSLRARRWEIEKELQSLAIIDRKVMIRMRDGTHIPADIYRPKDPSKKYPGVWVRTPYNFNYWDIQLGAPSWMSQ